MCRSKRAARAARLQGPGARTRESADVGAAPGPHAVHTPLPGTCRSRNNPSPAPPHLKDDSTWYGPGRVAVMPWMRGWDWLPKLGVGGGARWRWAADKRSAAGAQGRCVLDRAGMAPHTTRARKRNTRHARARRAAGRTCRCGGSGCVPCLWHSQTRPSGRTQTQSRHTLGSGWEKGRGQGARQRTGSAPAALGPARQRGQRPQETQGNRQREAGKPRARAKPRPPHPRSPSPPPACHLGSSSSGAKDAGTGGRRSSGRSPKKSHTKPPRSTTGYAGTMGRLGQRPGSALGTSRRRPSASKAQPW